jgi:hypothetical protein
MLMLISGSHDKKLNLLRCLLGAVATSIVEPMIKRINAGSVFSLPFITRSCLTAEIPP